MSESGLFTLKSGREIYMLDLKQSLTEAGRLEGVPTREGNARKLAFLTSELTKPYAAAPWIIPPVEEIIPWEDDYPYPFGTPSRLPRVTCIARIELRPTSAIPKDDAVSYGSGLMMLWFQEAFAFPLDPAVMKQLLEMDWDARATDFEL